MQIVEQLGTFYLGKTRSTTAGDSAEQLLLYDSKDLVTHAVCVGMTGSGKTGLCIALLEEAAIDGIPAIVVDPKGDLGNLLLTFPQLRPEDFLPWINESDAATKGMTPADFARQQAELWKNSLATWGEDGERIARLRDAAEFAIYTPGSSAGIPLSIVKSFGAPDPAVREDTELFREQVETTVSSLLGLVGIKADPVRSREHILLSSILTAAWNAGRSLDLPALIREVQSPPFSRVGILELDAFYPSKDRFELAMQLNNLLAAPGFARWTEGESLDVGALLYARSGKPRISIVSIAHLSDPERMFFLALLLNQVLGWVRRQSGTTSLRALLYIDEIAGFCPPVSNPPTKPSLLTLMKQARAFGLGVVLATQNPVDLDYKGLANAGTWFIGRMQTEQDVARVLDGLQAAAAQGAGAFDRASAQRTIAGLPKRNFLMNNVHESNPVVFETRWCMSYLRGPLTRDQIRMLMATQKPAPAATALPAPQAPPLTAQSPVTAVANRTFPQAGNNTTVPVLPPDIPQYFLRAQRVGTAATVEYAPLILGFADVHYRDSKRNVDATRRIAGAAPLSNGPVPVQWDLFAELQVDESDLDSAPVNQATFAPLPAECLKPRSYERWGKNLADTLFRTNRLELFESSALNMISAPGESERDFRARLSQAAREYRDAKAGTLRQKYAPKITRLEERIRRAQQTVKAQETQASQAKYQTALSFGAALLSGLLGRKKVSSGSVGKATTAMRGVGRTMQEGRDVARAEENLAALQQQLQELQSELEAEIAMTNAQVHADSIALERVTLKPRKMDISIRAVVLCWAPYVMDAAGRKSPASYAVLPIGGD